MNTYIVLTGISIFIQHSCFFNQERNLIIVWTNSSPSVPKSDKKCGEIFEITYHSNLLKNFIKAYVLHDSSVYYTSPCSSVLWYRWFNGIIWHELLKAPSWSKSLAEFIQSGDETHFISIGFVQVGRLDFKFFFRVHSNKHLFSVVQIQGRVASSWY